MEPSQQPWPQATDEDQDVCRVCREGKEDGPLFYPCQCTGSIRYVHESCLNEWLQRSKKTKCELCDTPLTYTKVFASSMPDKLPWPLLARHFLLSLVKVVVFILRAALVTFCWLVLLPYGTTWVMRFYLVSADGFASFAHLFTGRVSPAEAQTRDVVHILNFLFGFLAKPARETLGEPKERAAEALGDLLSNSTGWTWSAGDKSLLLRRAGAQLLGTSAQTPWVAKMLGGVNATLSEREGLLKVAKDVVFGGKEGRERLLGLGLSTPNRLGNLAELATLIKERESAARAALPVDPWNRIIKGLAADTFTGQIITSIVVVLFVVGFLIREFVLQNGPFPEPPAPVDLPVPDVALEAGAEALLRAGAIPPFLGAGPAATEIQEVLANLVVDHEALPDLEPIGDEDEDEDEDEGWRDWVDEDDEETQEDEQSWDEGPPVASTAGSFRDDRSWEERYASPSPERPSAPKRARAWSNDRDPYRSSASPSSSGASRTPTRHRTLSDSEDEDSDGERARREERRRRDERARRRSARAAAPPESRAQRRQRRRVERRADDLAVDWRQETQRGRLEGREASGRNHNDETESEEEEEEQEEPVLRQPEAPLALPHHPPAPPPLVPPPAFFAPPFLGAPAPPREPEAAQDDEDFADEEFPADVLDDFDGVLEAIGMKGPLLILVQNLGLMNLLIAICLGGALWIPLVLGKVLAASNAIKLATLPLRAVRSVSDPIFDGVFALVAWLPKRALSHLRPHLESYCTSAGPGGLAKLCAQFLPSPSALAVVASDVVSSAANPLANIATRAAKSPANLSTLQRAFQSVSSHWTAMAFDDDPLHRALCVVLGYVSAALGGAIYLQSTSTTYGQSLTRAVREGLKQQLILVKVCSFVFIEIIIFPITCGAILNLATLPLFPDATPWTRLAAYSLSPLSTTFVTWLSGTAFMFVFSSGIDCIRDLVREGVLFFIRDPASQEHSPIREILERNSSTQAKKIGISAALYAAAIWSTVGVSVYFLRYAIGVLPMRWVAGRPFAFPIDLVVYRFVVPLTIQVLNPGCRVKRIFLGWARFTASQLRLSSFIFEGGRSPAEEGSHVHRTWWSLLLLKKADPVLEAEDDDPDQISRREVVFRKDGGFGRVPAVDTIRVAQGRPMIVEVTEDGHPVTREGAKVIAAQVHEMTFTRTADRYCIVYIPPHFKARIGLFVYLLWFTGSLFGMSMVVLPLVLGRYIFSLFTPDEVHDIYALVVGIYAVAGVSLGLRNLLAVRHLRPSVETLLATQAGLRAAIMAGIALPLLASLFVTSYIVLPLSRPSSRTPDPDFPSVRLLESWAIGTMVVSTAYQVIRTRLAGRFRDPFDDLVAMWTTNRIEALHLVTKAAWEVVWRLGIAVLTPSLGAALTWWCHSTRLVGLGWSFYRVYQAAFRIAVCGLAIVLASQRVKGLASRWTGALREAEFLVERRLMNYSGRS